MSMLKRLELERWNAPHIYFNDNVGEVRLVVKSKPFEVVTCLSFDEVKKLYWWLDGWMDNERANCRNGCDHERSGCQTHDG